LARLVSRVLWDKKKEEEEVDVMVAGGGLEWLISVGQ